MRTAVARFNARERRKIVHVRQNRSAPLSP
jgi:hypothetical protein